MTDRDDQTDRAMKRLATSIVPVDAPERVDERRARLVPRLTAFADAEWERGAHRRNLFRVGAFAVAAVAVAAVVLVFVVRRDEPRSVTLEAKAGTVRVSHGGVTDDVAPNVPRPLSDADLLETLDGSAAVRLVTGAVVDLAAQSRLELTPVEHHARAVSERIRLSSGRVSVRVPKLAEGSKLIVGTPDATVTVHGTAFTVEVTKAPSGSMATSVIVTEGRVSVESGGRQLFLGPGSHWSSTPTEVAPATTAGDEPAASTAPAAPAAAPSTPKAARRSTLAAENELFRSAMTAMAGGDAQKAITFAERLLRAYPDSPLTAEARALESEARRKLGGAPSP